MIYHGIMMQYFSFVTKRDFLLSKSEVTDMVSMQSKLEVEFKTEPNGRNGSRTIEWVLEKQKGRKGEGNGKEEERKKCNFVVKL